MYEDGDGCGYAASWCKSGAKGVPAQAVLSMDPAPGHGTQSWILITGSINCPKPGKVNESGPGDMQEDQEENKSTRDKA